MSNKYLEKIAKERSEYSDARTAVGIGAAGIGSMVPIDEFHKGNITGRATLYHGTHPEYKPKILKEGIVPRASKGVIDEVEAANKQSLKSEGLSFMANSKSQGKFYANQAVDIKKGKFDPMMNDFIRAKYHSPVGEGAKKGVVKINAPTWKKNEFSKVRNPELRVQFKHIDSPFNFNFHTSKKQQKRNVYDLLEKNVFTNKGSVHPKYMPESPHYKPNSLAEVKQFVGGNKNRFLKGVGKSVAGLALAGAGIYNAAKGMSE